MMKVVQQHVYFGNLKMSKQYITINYPIELLSSLNTSYVMHTCMIDTVEIMLNHVQ